jgi:hypothetical protein
MKPEDRIRDALEALGVTIAFPLPRTSEEALAALDTLIKQRDEVLASRPVIADGWKLVPREPTEAMRLCGQYEGRMFLPEIRRADAEAIYKAMIAAAPPAEQQRTSEEAP